MMDFTTPRFLASTIYGDETGYANQMLVEVDQALWEKIVALHARSRDMLKEFGDDAEIALRCRGTVIVLNDLDDDDLKDQIPDSVYDWLHDLSDCKWFEGDPEDIRRMIAAMEEHKESNGRDYNTQPATLDAERLAVEATENFWSLYFRFELRKSDVALESTDVSSLFTLPE